MASAAAYFYGDPSVTPESIAQHVGDAVRPALIALDESFAALPWRRDAIATTLKETAARHGLKPPQVMMPLRYLVAGTASTPALDAVLSLLGREKVRARIAAGLAL
jgi:glutamyl-tRNA synthetase